MAYYRVSTVKQGESGLGLEAQRNTVEGYIASREGTLVGVYTEVESGKNAARPQLASAIADAKRQSAKLIIAKLDRLSRNVHFISSLMESGLDFVACDFPTANRMMLHMLAAVAEHEREMISARTKAGMDAARREITEKGFRISNRSKQAGTPKAYSSFGNPRWQESIEKCLAARWPQREATQVDQIIREKHAAGASLRAIAGALNELCLKTHSGAAWHASSVRAALLRMPQAA